MSEARGQKAAAQLQNVQGRVELPNGLSLGAVVGTSHALALTAVDTRIISDASAQAVANALDQCQNGFEARIGHALLERSSEKALVSSRSRQRLASSINAAFGRTGERFAPTRSPAIDSLGLPRSDNAFADMLLQALGTGNSARLQTRTLDQVLESVREQKSPDSLQSAFDALAKLLPTTVFSRQDRVRLVATFVQTQARLRANVIPMSSLTPGGQGLFGLVGGGKASPLSAFERDALLSRVNAAELPDLERMRQQTAATLTGPPFAPHDGKPLLQAIDARMMFLRAG